MNENPLRGHICEYFYAGERADSQFFLSSPDIFQFSTILQMLNIKKGIFYEKSERFFEISIFQMAHYFDASGSSCVYHSKKPTRITQHGLKNCSGRSSLIAVFYFLINQVINPKKINSKNTDQHMRYGGSHNCLLFGIQITPKQARQKNH